MSVWKKLTKAVQKPFKELGNGWWNDVRYPLVGAAVGAATGGIGAAYGAFGAATATTGALYGAGAGAMAGNMVGQAHMQQRMAADEEAAAARAAQQQYNASLQPAATPTAVDSPALADANYSADRKRRFSLSRTTMQRASLLGSSGMGRTTLG